MNTDRLTAEPLYRRAELEMIARIVGRVWRPGMRLPNEFELAAEFGVSQGTVRKALTALEARGLLTRSPGRGTEVTRTTQAEALYAFFRLRDAEGNLVVPEPLEERVLRRAAGAEEQRLLAPPNGEVYGIERVRQHAGTAFALERVSLSASLCDGLEADAPLPNSLYPYLQDRFGLAIMRAEESLSAVVASEAEARSLRLEAGTPLLCVRRQARDLSDRIVELRTSLYLTRFATYQVELTRSGSLAALPVREGNRPGAR